jgi:lambda family phage minor tail protein L
MTTNEKIASDWQQEAVGELVTLYVLDCSDIGGSTYRFTNMTSVSGGVYSAVVFQGQTYYPVDIEAKGFEYTGDGQLPRPTLKLNSRETTIKAAISTYDDLLGSVVYRKRTFKKYLDNQPDADSTAEFPIDIYIIEKKLVQNNIYVEFELSAYMDHTGKKIPGRTVIKSTCTHTYRYWNGSSFTYGSCPYDGANYFERDGTPTVNEDEDKCGKRLSDCELRFGENNPLYTRAFPGVGRLR